MLKAEAFTHVFEPQSLGRSINSTLISVCKVLIFLNYFFSPFDHWIVGDRSWRPILDLLPEKLDLPTWIQISCLIILLLAPSVLFSVATVLTTPRDKFAWSSYFLQALVIGPIFLVFLAVVAVMVRSGIETTTPDVESKSDQTSSSSTDSPLTLLTATVIRVVLAGLTNAVLQRLSSAPPESVQSNPLLFQAGLVAILSFCKSNHAQRRLINLFQKLGLPVLSSPPPLTTRSLLYSLTIFGNEEQTSLITPVRGAVSYILVNLYPHLFGRPMLLFSRSQGFDVELRDPRDVFSSLPAKRGYRIGGDWALWGILCIAELTIGVALKLVFPWIWMPLQQLKETAAWFKNAADVARIVLGISTAMLRAIWACDWSAIKNVASTTYQDYKYGVFFVGFNIITIAFAVFVGLCLEWFNGYLAKRSAQL
ncbi:hypothetical protein D6C86_08965 [Aureobasidium pullulans]|uniref:Uncharacterized protein n=1 Tax=Aureobasidium pullulans TaxID=5580 RepID=A0A4S9YMN0_AURPU|nr:hypothetical protein D6C94_07238 [Aureobasidium pullulans]THZ45734.1 hypothetical protein D6C87_02639 [Aureobasidium pullulans]THZ55015.1 hypothetical protein D6C86_08965 [Aureobasidium pullulans]THZ93143.1 hypothetical protein D6C88_02852 [Aureobasidium pullulans]